MKATSLLVGKDELHKRCWCAQKDYFSSETIARQHEKVLSDG